MSARSYLDEAYEEVMGETRQYLRESAAHPSFAAVDDSEIAHCECGAEWDAFCEKCQRYTCDDCSGFHEGGECIEKKGGKGQ